MASGSKRHLVIGSGSGFIGAAPAVRLRERRECVTLISRFAGPDRITWEDLDRDGLPVCDTVVIWRAITFCEPAAAEPKATTKP